jgi:predicted nucleotidyltransferase
MNIFDEYTHTLLTALNKHKVEYIVIGGYAVNYHGYRRTTGDIDLWIKPDNGLNKDKLLTSFKELGVGDLSLEKLNKKDFTKPFVFIDGKEPFKIDFLTHISGVKFDEAWKQKQTTEIDGIEMHFLHLNHLILSKITTGRAQDKIDIEQLQKIQKLKKGKKL